MMKCKARKTVCALLALLTAVSAAACSAPAGDASSPQANSSEGSAASDASGGDTSSEKVTFPLAEPITLEQMEYHWIDPNADQTLQQGLDEDADDKQLALACMRVDEAGLAEFYELFHPERYDYTKNAPCCEFYYPVNGQPVELSFRMNEAGLSKLGTDWLRQFKDRLDSGEWLTYTPKDESEGTLAAVFVAQTRRIGLVYRQPEKEQYFQIFLNPDGTKADAIWSSAENKEAEVYTQEEMSAVEQHIKKAFGEFENIFHELASPDIHVDICVIPPSEKRDYRDELEYKLEHDADALLDKLEGVSFVLNPARPSLLMDQEDNSLE